MGAWAAGRDVAMRKDWEVVKVRAMYTANKEKFLQNEGLRDKLLATKSKIDFGNGFWPRWNGIILEGVRA